ncbi:MAG: hypothetical protein ABWK01_04150 [Infirmifilum sp.]
MASTIKNLRERKDPRSALMLDILRALVAFGGSLWLSELSDAINRVYLGSAAPIEPKELRDAVKELSKLNLVKAEERLKASEKAGGEKDVLLTLATREVNLGLMQDEVLSKYYAGLTRILTDFEDN